MSIIERSSQIPFMYRLRHIHDEENHDDFGFNYENEIFNKTVSPFLMMNENVKETTNFLSKIMSIMVDGSQSVRNMFYYTHSKYYNKHGK